MRHACGRAAGNYTGQFWRSRKRSEAEQHTVIHRANGSFEIPTLPVTPRKLARHGHLYGVKGVEDFLAIVSKSGASDSCLAISVSMRGKSSRSSTPDGLPSSPWNSTKTRNLGGRIVSLHKLGLGAMAIADTVGKSDGVVKRYLREAGAAGFLARVGVTESPSEGHLR
jgi:hypothetical protein